MTLPVDSGDGPRKSANVKLHFSEENQRLYAGMLQGTYASSYSMRYGKLWGIAWPCEPAERANWVGFIRPLRHVILCLLQH